MAYTTLSYNCIAAYILRFLLIRSEYLKIVKICCNSILSDVNNLAYYLFLIHAANALKSALKITLS